MSKQLLERVEAQKQVIFQAQSICRLATARLRSFGDTAPEEVISNVMDALDGAVALMDQAAAGHDASKVRADAEVSHG